MTFEPPQPGAALVDGTLGGGERLRTLDQALSIFPFLILLAFVVVLVRLARSRKATEADVRGLALPAATTVGFAAAAHALMHFDWGEKSWQVFLPLTLVACAAAVQSFVVFVRRLATRGSGPVAADPAGAGRERSRLAESERTLSFAIASAGTAAWSCDFRAGVFDAGPELRALFELPDDGQPLSLEDLRRRTHPSDRERAFDDLTRRGDPLDSPLSAWSGGPDPDGWGVAPERDRPFDLEFRLVRPGGEERWVHARGKSYIDPRGEPYLAAGVFQDVTERKRLEFEREIFRLVPESSGDVFGFLSNDLSYCYLNPAGEELLLSSQGTGDVRGALLHLLGAPSERVLERFENGHQRNLVIRTPYESRTLQVRVHVVHPPSYTEPLGLAVVGRDVSKEQRYKEELEKAVRSRDEFLAMVSHDLRNPMNVILGWVQILRNNPVSREQYQRILASLEKNAKLQDKLIADLLDVTRLMNGKMMFRPTRTRLVEFITHVCESARLTAAQKNIRLVTALPDSELWIHADAERLQQVLWNLLSNAVKFTQEGGEIRVGVTVDAGEVHLEVSDNGQGIEPDKLAHVFDRFWQETASGARKGGLGLGLSIVKGIVELHGGTIGARSDGRGQGTTFVVSLPHPTASEGARPTSDAFGAFAVSADGSPTTNPLGATRAGAAAQDDDGMEAVVGPLVPVEKERPRVLVVEDSPEISELFSSMLGLLGCEVDTAATAREGLSKVLAKDYHLLLADLELPREDGFWLVDKLREVEGKLGGRNVRVIACSAKYAVNRNELRSLGFDDFLPKPVGIGDLEKVLSGLEIAPSHAHARTGATARDGETGVLNVSMAGVISGAVECPQPPISASTPPGAPASAAAQNDERPRPVVGHTR